MTTMDEAIANIANQMQKEIDNEIVERLTRDTLIRNGWTTTDVRLAANDKIATAAWCHLNATGDYKLLLGQWLFERAEDATMFILRWK